MVSSLWKGASSLKRYRDPLFAPEKRRHPALVFLIVFLSFIIAVLLRSTPGQKIHVPLPRDIKGVAGRA